MPQLQTSSPAYMLCRVLALLAWMGIALPIAAQSPAQSAAAAAKAAAAAAQPYIDQGVAAASQGNFDAAIQDFTQAMQLDPTTPVPYFQRGLAYYDKNDCDHAVLDLDQAIAQTRNPRDGVIYLHFRGQANVCRGVLPAALLDFDRVVKVRQDYYREAVLWRHIIKKRLNLDDAEEFIKASANFDWSKWPTAVMEFYLGQATAEAVLAGARDRDPRTEKLELCQARFYLAEYDLLQHRPADAVAGLQRARSSCTYEWGMPGAINSELKFFSGAGGR